MKKFVGEPYDPEREVPDARIIGEREALESDTENLKVDKINKSKFGPRFITIYATPDTCEFRDGQDTNRIDSKAVDLPIIYKGRPEEFLTETALQDWNLK